MNMNRTLPDAVADFGGFYIEESLFRQEMSLQAYYVRMQVEQECDVTLDNNVEAWSVDYGNVNPLLLLKQYALESAVRSKAIFVLARESGILKTDNFDVVSADYAGAFWSEPLDDSAIVGENEWRYSAFMDAVTSQLIQSLRDQITDSDIKTFIEETGVDYLSEYINMSPEERESPALLSKAVCADRRRSVVLDLMQNKLFESQIAKLLDTNDVSVRSEAYDAVLPDF